MLKPTSSIILHQTIDKKQKLLNEHLMSSQTVKPYKKNKGQKPIDIETNNTIKLDFSAMSKVGVSDQAHSRYTRCHCGAFLMSEEEKDHFQKNQDGQYLWVCRFCTAKNVSKELHFVSNNFKAVLEKNVQKLFLPPILLFLIDLSGSMGETISVQLDLQTQRQSNLMTASKQIVQIIKNSLFQQKQAYKLDQLKQRYRYNEQKQQFKKAKMQGIQYYSKICLFMGIIENCICKIRNSKDFIDFRVGFIFFNQNLYVMKPTKQKVIPTFMSTLKIKQKKTQKDFPFQINQINFNDYDMLFNAGRKFQRFFGDSKLKNSDLSKLMVQNLDTEGQTALGPALAFALGITSVHDIGSRIILISDAMPNMGILSSQTSTQNQHIYSQINKYLQKRQVTIGILNWVTQQTKSYHQKQKSQFSKFLNSDKERIKEICLDFSLGLNQHSAVLDTAKRTVEGLVNRGSIGQVLSINTYSSNSKIQINKFKYDQIDFRFVKFLGLQHKNYWIQTKAKKPSQQDYLFPIYIQIVIQYYDVFTKQKILYMSYTKQKLVNVNAICQKQQPVEYEYLQQANKKNIRQLLDLQKLYKFDRDNIVTESVASRNIQYASIKFGEGSQAVGSVFDFSLCSSLNQLAELENRRNLEIDEQDNGDLYF